MIGVGDAAADVERGAAGPTSSDDATTIASVRRWALDRPDGLAFDSLRGQLTYARLWREVEGMAAALLAYGVEPSAPVGHVVGNGPRQLLAMLALYRLGAGALSFAPNEPTALRAPLMARAGARVCVGTSADALDGVPHVAIDRLTGPGDPRALPPMPPAEATAYFGRSSGTSRGIPKLVETPFSLIAVMDRMVSRPFPVAPDDRYFLLSPLWGLYGRYHARYALVSGATVIFPPAMRTDGEIRAAARELRATTTALTAFQAQRMVKGTGNEPLLAGIRVAVGVAPLSAAERRAVMTRISPKLHIGYGASEVGGITMATPEDLAADIETVGRPYDGIEAEAVGADDQPLAAGTIGSLRFRAAHFATSYVDDVPGSTSRFAGGWFYPGDAGSIDAAGRIRLAGRSDEFLDVGGLKTHPGEIERVIGRHPAVDEVSVVGVPSERYGEEPVAAVVLVAPTDEESLRRFCAANLSARFCPGRFHYLDALPRTDVGKVDREAVRRLFVP